MLNILFIWNYCQYLVLGMGGLGALVKYLSILLDDFVVPLVIELSLPLFRALQWY